MLLQSSGLAACSQLAPLPLSHQNPHPASDMKRASIFVSKLLGTGSYPEKSMRVHRIACKPKHPVRFVAGAKERCCTLTNWPACMRMESGNIRSNSQTAFLKFTHSVWMNLAGCA
jgi:hypothetical protein